MQSGDGPVGPCTSPENESERGVRRLMHSVRKSLQNLDDAYHTAVESQNAEDERLADDLRAILSSETEELKRQVPQLSAPLNASCADLLTRVASMLERRRFQSLCEETSPVEPRPLESLVGRSDAVGPRRGIGVPGSESQTVMTDPATTRHDRDSTCPMSLAPGPEPEVGRSASNHSIASNASSHAEMTQSRIESNRRIFEAEQRAQELEGRVVAEQKRRDEAVRAERCLWEEELRVERARGVREINQIRFEMQADCDRKIALLRDEWELREKRHQEQLRAAAHAPARTLPSQNTSSQGTRSEPARVVSWVQDLPTSSTSIPSARTTTVTYTTASLSNSYTRPITHTQSVPACNIASPNATPFSALPGYFIPRQQSTHSAPVPGQIIDDTLPLRSIASEPILPNCHISAQGARDDTAALLSIQTQAHAYQMLMQRRPKFKFTGDHKKIDFEAFVLQCEGLLKIPGATAEMQLAELPYWFGGTAGLITDRYLGAQDAKEALATAFRALKKEFGKRHQTAKQLLTDALAGKKLPSTDYTLIKSFALNLEKIFKVAQETKREESFHLPETIYEIIRTKVQH